MRSWAIAITWLAACLILLPLQAGSLQSETSQPDKRVNLNSIVMVILKDVQPLYGGQNLYLSRNGTGFCQLVSRHPGVPALFEKRYRFALPSDAMRELLQLISDHSFVDIASSVKPGLPDSAKPTISVRFASGKSVSVSRWLHDNHTDFDAIYRALLEVVKSSAQTGKLVDGRQYDPKWTPEEFGAN
jgi:hypothetical protein